jgi:thioredoxin reductase (NADPH)
MFDIIIIGAGPSGLAVAIEAQQNGLKYCVIEKGGIVNAIRRFPTEMTFFSTPELLEIGNIPFTSAHMRPTRTEGLEYYIKVADHYSLDLRLYEEVRSVAQFENGFTVTTNLGIYESKNVVIATGFYDNANVLHVPGEDLPKVSHYYTEPYAYYRQQVAVIGAKNSAAIAALELYRHGAHVTMIHRGDRLSEKIKYWILPDIENRIKEGSIIAHFNTSIDSIHEKKLILRQTERTFEISNNFVFALTGYHPDYDFLRSAGIELDSENNAPVHSPDTFETHLAGVFVAGSVVAGKNNNRIFIENGRHHGKQIIASILSRKR